MITHDSGVCRDRVHAQAQELSLATKYPLPFKNVMLRIRVTLFAGFSVLPGTLGKS